MSQLPPGLQTPSGVPPSQTQPPQSQAPKPQAPPQQTVQPAPEPAQQAPPGEAAPDTSPPGPQSGQVPGQVIDGIQQAALPPAGAPEKPEVPRIAILLPLSGPSAKVGQDLLNAAQLALFHFADQRFELLPRDTRGTPEGAADAAARAIADGASLILGPLLSGSAEAVAPAARAAGINVIAFTSDRTVAGGGVFTMGFLPGQEVARIVAFARQRGVRRLAVLAPDNDYGLRVVEQVRQSAEAPGLFLTDIAYYDPLAADFAPVVRDLANYDARRRALLDQVAALRARDDEVAAAALKRLENLQTLGDVPFDALLIADGGKRLQAIAALLPYYDLDPKKVRMLGTGQWDTPGLGAEPALVGGWFAAPSPAARADFVEQYRAAYGAPPHRLATLAYDATALAAVLAREDGGFQPEKITATQGFAGRDGIFRFLPTGIAQRGLSVLHVGERSTAVIADAPSNFAQPAVPPAPSTGPAPNPAQPPPAR